MVEQEMLFMDHERSSLLGQKHNRPVPSYQGSAIRWEMEIKFPVNDFGVELK
jgi:hypothetical protein